MTWETANCLSLCACSPGLILYPEDISYTALDVETLEHLIQAYITPCSFGEDPDDGSKK